MQSVAQMKSELAALEAELKINTTMSDTYKILLNGSFGKLGSKWSTLYAPDLMVHVTLTGQLCLLMLIEQLEAAGIQVVSANTDGVVMYCDKAHEALVGHVVDEWELRTGFETEETRYEAYYGRDVNNYIAIKSPTAKSPERGLVKLKGEYAPPTALFGSWPNPANEICVAAVINYLVLGLDIETTIRECRDINQFVTIRTVKGGALKDGNYLGKAIRWYYSTKASGVIQYKINGYTVARTEGAMPCMTLPDELPEDVNYEWYVKEAQSMLVDLGVSIC